MDGTTVSASALIGLLYGQMSMALLVKKGLITKAEAIQAHEMMLLNLAKQRATADPAGPAIALAKQMVKLAIRELKSS